MSAIWLAGHGLTQGEQSIDFPRPDRLVQGNPQRQTYSLYERQQTRILSSDGRLHPYS